MVKNLLNKSSDPNLALLSYLTIITPLSWCDLSPAELEAENILASNRQDVHFSMGILED